MADLTKFLAGDLLAKIKTALGDGVYKELEAGFDADGVLLANSGDYTPTKDVKNVFKGDWLSKDGQVNLDMIDDTNLKGYLTKVTEDINNLRDTNNNLKLDSVLEISAVKKGITDSKAILKYLDREKLTYDADGNVTNADTLVDDFRTSMQGILGVSYKEPTAPVSTPAPASGGFNPPPAPSNTDLSNVDLANLL